MYVTTDETQTLLALPSVKDFARGLRKIQEEACEAGAAISHAIDRGEGSGESKAYRKMVLEVADLCVAIAALEVRYLGFAEDLSMAKRRKLAALKAEFRGANG